MGSGAVHQKNWCGGHLLDRAFGEVLLKLEERLKRKKNDNEDSFFASGHCCETVAAAKNLRAGSDCT